MMLQHYMKRFLFGILSLGLLLAGCQEPVDPVVDKVAGPKLVSSDPADGAKDLTGEKLTLVMTFDQNIKCPSAQREKITVDNGAVIDNVNPNMAELKIELSSLEGGKTYSVYLPAGTIFDKSSS